MIFCRPAYFGPLVFIEFDGKTHFENIPGVLKNLVTSAAKCDKIIVSFHFY